LQTSLREHTGAGRSIWNTARAEDLLLAAKRLDLKAWLGLPKVHRAESGALPLPCIVELRDSSSVGLALDKIAADQSR
jgi:hypothetical protein